VFNILSSLYIADKIYFFSKIRAGFPTTVTPAGILFVTTAPIPITAPFPITKGLSGVPCLIIAPVPI
jgi:hypothetical protein